jgi:hypothetical protein
MADWTRFWKGRPAELARDWRPRQAMSRRSILRGFARGAAVSVALPPLEAMFNSTGTAYACDGILPRRFGVWFWGNGMLPERWIPTGEGQGDAWALSEQLAPLASMKHKLAVITGLACKVPNISPHGSGAACLLTAGQDQEAADGSRLGPSIDQVIADSIGATSIYKSIQTTATSSNGQSWNGPGSQNAAERDPYALYARLFGDTFIEPGEEGVVDPRLGLRRSVLDAVMGDISGLQDRLGAADKQRLEQHLEGVREIEQRLAILQENPPNLESCVRADMPTADYADIDGRPVIYERNAIMTQLLAMSLACDQTRVFGHYLTDPVSDVLFPEAPAGHHDLTHNEGGEQPNVNAITIRCIEMFAQSLEILDSIPEGEGSLLDNCAILGCSEVSLAQTHNIEEMPTIIAGSACGFFQQDVHYRSTSKVSTTRLLISLQQAMGMTVSEFGFDEAAENQGLSEIHT